MFFAFAKGCSRLDSCLICDLCWELIYSIFILVLSTCLAFGLYFGLFMWCTVPNHRLVQMELSRRHQLCNTPHARQQSEICIDSHHLFQVHLSQLQMGKKAEKAPQLLQQTKPSLLHVVFGIAPPRGSWFYHYFWKVVFDEQFFLRCEVSQSIAPATQNEVPCPMILNFFIFIIFWRSLNFFLNAFFVCVVLWSVTIYCACHTKWGSSSLVSSCLHVQFLFDEVLFSLFFRLCGLCDVSQSIAPATQNHVPCPMILNFYIFLSFFEKWRICFFLLTFVVGCHDRWCWWEIIVFCWLSWHGVGGVGGDIFVRCGLQTDWIFFGTDVCCNKLQPKLMFFGGWFTLWQGGGFGGGVGGGYFRSLLIANRQDVLRYRCVL